MHSVCPSVYGWNAVDNDVRVPASFHNVCQNSAVNRESQSETIDFGIPWCRTTSEKNKRASSSAVACMLVARKCARFDNLSIITKIASIPDSVLGRFVI